MATKTLYFNFLLLLVILYSCNNPEVTQFKKEKNNKSAIYLGHNDTVKYVGKEQCRMCHAEIYDSYIQTGMGRSLNYATKNNSVLSNKDIPVIYDDLKNFYYKPFFKNDSLYIKEFRLDNKDTVHKRIERLRIRLEVVTIQIHIYMKLMAIFIKYLTHTIHKRTYQICLQDMKMEEIPGFQEKLH